MDVRKDKRMHGISIQSAGLCPLDMFQPQLGVIASRFGMMKPQVVMILSQLGMI